MFFKQFLFLITFSISINYVFSQDTTAINNKKQDVYSAINLGLSINKKPSPIASFSFSFQNKLLKKIELDIHRYDYHKLKTVNKIFQGSLNNLTFLLGKQVIHTNKFSLNLYLGAIIGYGRIKSKTTITNIEDYNLVYNPNNNSYNYVFFNTSTNENTFYLSKRIAGGKSQLDFNYQLNKKLYLNYQFSIIKFSAKAFDNKLLDNDPTDKIMNNAQDFFLFSQIGIAVNLNK